MTAVVEQLHLRGQHDQQAHAGGGARRGGDRTGYPEVDAVIEDFLDEPLGDWTTSDTKIGDMEAADCAGACDSVAEQFTEYATERGLKVYTTRTSVDEMGYEITGDPAGQVMDADGNVVDGFYQEHTVNQVYVDGQGWPLTIDFTARQYGYDTPVKTDPAVREEDLAVEVFHLQGQHDQQRHAGGRGRDPLAPGTGVYQDDYGTLEIRSTGVDQIRQAVYDYLGGEDVFDIVVIENDDGTRSVDVENLYGSEGSVEGERALESYLNEGGIDDVSWDGERGTLHASHRGAINEDPVMKEFTSRVETTFSGAFETPDGEAFQIGETRFAFMEATGENAARAEINGTILDAGGEAVGTFSRAVYADGVVYNHSLNIYPEFQGQGIGTAFLDRTEPGLGKELRMSAVNVGKYAWAARGYRLDHRSNSTIVADTRDRWIFEARNALSDTPEWRAGDYTTIDRLAALEREWQNDITSIYPGDLIEIDPSLKSVLLNGPSWDAVRELDGGLTAAAGIMVFHLDGQHDQSTHGRRGASSLTDIYGGDVGHEYGGRSFTTARGETFQIEAEVETADDGSDGSVSGLIIDRDGSTIGSFTREFDFERGVVDNSSLNIDDNRQGEGIGTAFLEATEGDLVNMGITRARVTAVDVGQYAWAARGYRVLLNDRSKVIESWIPAAQEMIAAEPGEFTDIQRARVDAVAASWAAGGDIYGADLLAVSNRFKDVFLEGPDWKGGRDFAPADRQRPWFDENQLELDLAARLTTFHLQGQHNQADHGRRGNDGRDLWAIQGYSHGITAAAAVMTDANGQWDRHGFDDDQAGIAASLLEHIQSQPVNDSKTLYSGHGWRPGIEEGKMIDIPLMSVTPQQSLADWYRESSEGPRRPHPLEMPIMKRILKPYGGTMDGFAEAHGREAADAFLEATAAKSIEYHRPSVLFEFENSQSIPLRDNERLVSGRYEIVEIRDSASEGSWYRSAEDPKVFVEGRAKVAKLRFVEPLKIEDQNPPEARFSVATFHLQGQHDQQTHAGGRSEIDKARLAEVYQGELKVTLPSGTVETFKIQSDVYDPEDMSMAARRGDQFMIQGVILNDADRIAGQFTRVIEKDGSVRNVNLDVDARFQGLGIGTAFLDQTEAALVESGATQFKVHAAGDVGRMAWASRGYRLDPEDDVKRITARWLDDPASDGVRERWPEGDERRVKFEALRGSWESGDDIYPGDLIAIDRDFRGTFISGPAWYGLRDVESREELAVEQFHLQGQHDQQTHAGDRASALGEDVTLDDLEWEPAEGVTADEIVSRFDLSDGGREYATTSGGRLYRAPDDRYVMLDPEGDDVYVTIVPDLYEAESNLDLDQLESDIEDSWREDVVRGPVYHGTRDDESLQSIMAGGLERRNETRGLNNRWVGSSVFTTVDPELASQYGSVVEVDLPQAITDGAISADSLSREPGYNRADAMQQIAYSFDDYNFEPYSQYVGSGEDPNTVIISSDIPARYIRPLDELSGAIMTFRAERRVADRYAVYRPVEPPSVLEQFHLQGEHDQQSHAGGRGRAPEAGIVLDPDASHMSPMHERITIDGKTQSDVGREKWREMVKHQGAIDAAGALSTEEQEAIEAELESVSKNAIAARDPALLGFGEHLLMTAGRSPYAAIDAESTRRSNKVYELAAAIPVPLTLQLSHLKVADVAGLLGDRVYQDERFAKLSDALINSDASSESVSNLSAYVTERWGVTPASGVFHTFNDGWKESSRSARSLAVQREVAARYDIDTTGFDSFIDQASRGQDMTGDWLRQQMPKTVGGYVDGTYRRTQEFLAGTRAKEIPVYRGVKGDTFKPTSGEVVTGNPISSWTTSEPVAMQFSDAAFNRPGRVLVDYTDVADVFAISAVTGMGAIVEHEVILLGRPQIVDEVIENEVRA